MDDLEKLHAQIADLQKKATELATQRKAAAIEDIKAKILANGITAKDLGLYGKDAAKSRGKDTTKAHTTAGTTVAIKYQHGQSSWSGRGRQPKFIADYVAGGGKLEDLLV